MASPIDRNFHFPAPLPRRASPSPHSFDYLTSSIRRRLRRKQLNKYTTIVNPIQFNSLCFPVSSPPDSFHFHALPMRSRSSNDKRSINPLEWWDQWGEGRQRWAWQWPIRRGRRERHRRRRRTRWEDRLIRRRNEFIYLLRFGYPV